jgi:hypothetical protein
MTVKVAIVVPALFNYVGSHVSQHVFMNPSLAQDPADPSSIWIAARVHRKDSETHS